jgi:rare lipoprotein A (peptidoglycan hydrolase)
MPSRNVAARPKIDLPTPVKVEAKAVPRPKLTGHRVAGSSTWYCRPGVSACHHAYSGGLYAAAGSELRIGAWRGRQVKVCAGGDCVWVRLIDTCACGGARIIDLYSDAFRRLAPLDSGVLRVTVSW